MGTGRGGIGTFPAAADPVAIAVAVAAVVLAGVTVAMSISLRRARRELSFFAS
jgi:hypothetical protein